MAAIAISVWFVQMLEVAFSRRMCCSRACRVSTYPAVPSTSTRLPDDPARASAGRRRAGSAMSPRYGPAEVQVVAEGLPLRHRDVGAELAGRREHAERERVEDLDRRGPRRRAPRRTARGPARGCRARSGAGRSRRPRRRATSGAPPRPPRRRRPRARSPLPCRTCEASRRTAGRRPRRPAPGPGPASPRHVHGLDERGGAVVERGVATPRAPVSSQIIDWNSNSACSTPCDSSGW